MHHSALPLATHNAVWVLPLMVGWMVVYADSGKAPLPSDQISARAGPEHVFLSMFLTRARYVMV